MADIYEKKQEYDNAIHALETALSVQSYSSDWRDDAEYFNGYVEDRLSLFYYYQKNNPLKAAEYCLRALEQDPNNSRIRSNLEFYYNSINEKWGA